MQLTRNNIIPGRGGRGKWEMWGERGGYNASPRIGHASRGWTLLPAFRFAHPVLAALSLTGGATR
jgi:hypothetical protein